MDEVAERPACDWDWKVWVNELERERERERGDSCLGTIDAPFKEDPVGTIVNIYSSLSILFIQKALQASV